MLALIDKNTHGFIQEVLEATGWLELPNGDAVSGYADGWENDNYALATIGPGQSIPENKVISARSVGILFDDPFWEAYYSYTFADTPRPTSAEVNVERDRRIAAGFTFNGKAYAMDDQSKARISGAATLAGFAAITGAGAGNYRWADANVDFVWIANDNTLTLMDAPTCFAFGKAAAAWESANIFAARAIKESDPVPYDFTDDAYWPNS